MGRKTHFERSGMRRNRPIRRGRPLSSSALTAVSAPPVDTRRNERASTGPSLWALFAGLALYAAIFLATIRHSFLQDTWLGLVTGREVWQSGIPHHEPLTSLAHGRDWVDQQWLS